MLNPAEAKLFAKGVCLLLDSYRDGLENTQDGWHLTTGPFESLTEEQKFTVLEEVTLALLTETPVPEHTAVREHAVYYIYRFLANDFADDVALGEAWYGQDILDVLGRSGKAPEETEEDGRGKKKILKTTHKGSEEQDEEAWENENAEFDPYMGCLDADKWSNALEEIADRILWDRDFEMGFVSPGMMGVLHIQPNYFKGKVVASPGAEDRLYALCKPFCED